MSAFVMSLVAYMQSLILGLVMSVDYIIIPKFNFCNVQTPNQ